jgi:hypothetical protein
MKAVYQSAQVNLEQAKWNLSKTRIYTLKKSYSSNLQARPDNGALP